MPLAISLKCVWKQTEAAGREVITGVKYPPAAGVTIYARGREKNTEKSAFCAQSIERNSGQIACFPLHK